MSLIPTDDYKQRQSDNLMNIVAVIYGVALTAALTSHQKVLLHPQFAANLLPLLALSAAGILTAFSFYIYVFSTGAKPYNVIWTQRSMAWHAIFRFATDVALAILYVLLLFTATDVKTGAKSAPSLADFVFSFFLVFIGAVVVRWVRRDAISVPGLIAAAISLGFWFLLRYITTTRKIDLGIVSGAVLFVLAYCGFNYWFIYRKWRKANRTSAAEPADVAGAAAKSAGAAAKSAEAAAKSAEAAAKSAEAAAQLAANAKDAT